MPNSGGLLFIRENHSFSKPVKNAVENLLILRNAADY